MNKTPLLEFVYNRKKTAAKNREAAVELRITFERKQKYMTTGIRLLPKHWHRGAVVNRIDARELNETLEKLMAEVRQVILDMMGESVMDIFTIHERLKRKRASAISFLEFCEQRSKIRQYGKADVILTSGFVLTRRNRKVALAMPFCLLLQRQLFLKTPIVVA